MNPNNKISLCNRNLIIVGEIILALLLGIVLLSKKPAPKPVTNPNPSGQDFNVVDKKEEVVFNTSTPAPTLKLQLYLKMERHIM